MRADKRKRLEAAGWRIGDAKDFLELDEVDAQLVEMKLTLARKLRELREQLAGPGSGRQLTVKLDREIPRNHLILRKILITPAFSTTAESGRDPLG